MKKFQLFRLRLFMKPTLFVNNVDRAELLQKIINDRPSAELRKGHWWHIGNVESVDESGAHFAFGRTTKSTVDLYDNETGDFVMNKQAGSPYTHAYIDYSLQLLAIAHKPSLEPSAGAIARQLEKLFNKQEALEWSYVAADIAPLIDPQEFLAHIKAASIVQSFTAEITLPNAVDSHEEFEKPYQRFVRATEGNKGKTMVQGDDLNREVLAEIARACAAAGNNASARLKDSERGRFKTRHLKGRAVTLKYKDQDPGASSKSFLYTVRETYKTIAAGQKEE